MFDYYCRGPHMISAANAGSARDLISQKKIDNSISLAVYCLNVWPVLRLTVTAPFNNMRTLNFKAQPKNAFSLPSILIIMKC